MTARDQRLKSHVFRGSYILACLFLIPSLQCTDREFYVCPSGNDDWSGLQESPTTDNADGPFKSLARACELMRAGDTCYVRAGKYHETLRPLHDGTPGRPIIFKAYKNENPIIFAADQLQGWRAEGDKTYSTSMNWDLKDQNQVFWDTTPLSLARWPKNTGSLMSPTLAIAESGSENSLTCSQIPDVDLTGTNIFCAGGSGWIFWHAPIASYSPSTSRLEFDQPIKSSFYTAKKGSRFAIFGSRSLLTAHGEWWLDASNSRLYLLPLGGKIGPDDAIYAKRRIHCVDLSDRRFITIQGISFFSGGVITNGNTSNITLTGCTGTYVAHSFRRNLQNSAGIIINGLDNSVENCEFSYSSSSIISVSGHNNRIVNSYIHHGDYAANWSGAVALSGQGTVFSHNTVAHSGRDLLTIHGLNSGFIQFNDLSDAGTMTQDVGIIYGHNTDFMNTVISCNLIHDSLAHGLSMGIYLDHCSHNIVIHDNIIYNTKNDPIRINNPSYFNVVRNNSCFKTGVTTTFDHSYRDDLWGCRYIHNIFNDAIRLPKSAVCFDNIIINDPGYADPDNGDFSIRNGSSKVGAFSYRRQPPRFGHDFSIQSLAIDHINDNDPGWTNSIRDACFESGSFEFWTIQSPLNARFAKGNNWGNAPSGASGFSATGTSRYELALGPKAASAEQKVLGLIGGIPHHLSGWIRSSSTDCSGRIGIRLGDGTEVWSAPSHATTWQRLVVDFTPPHEPQSVNILIHMEGTGDGLVYFDNLGLPREPQPTQ